MLHHHLWTFDATRQPYCQLCGFSPDVPTFHEGGIPFMHSQSQSQRTSPTRHQPVAIWLGTVLGVVLQTLALLRYRHYRVLACWFAAGVGFGVARALWQTWRGDALEQHFAALRRVNPTMQMHVMVNGHRWQYVGPDDLPRTAEEVVARYQQDQQDQQNQQDQARTSDAYLEVVANWLRTNRRRAR